MKYILLVVLVTLNVYATEPKRLRQASSKQIFYNVTVKQKKQRFYKLIVPAVNKVHNDLTRRYLSVKRDIKNGTNNIKIQELKNSYDVTTDKELLQILKPHPKSIAIAQAAIESGWGTSRIFLQANNIFGMWSYNKNEPRIVALKKRGGTQTVWLKKFNTLEESIRRYYRTIAIGPAYKEFRDLKMKTSSPLELVKKLDKYSELRTQYVKILTSVIKQNQLTKYDNVY